MMMLKLPADICRQLLIYQHLTASRDVRKIGEQIRVLVNDIVRIEIYNIIMLINIEIIANGDEM
jgi:hypothetical protein